MNISEQHALSPETKTVVLRKCWSVIFDCNGNADGIYFEDDNSEEDDDGA